MTGVQRGAGQDKLPAKTTKRPANTDSQWSDAFPHTHRTISFDAGNPLFKQNPLCAYALSFLAW